LFFIDLRPKNAAIDLFSIKTHCSLEQNDIFISRIKRQDKTSSKPIRIKTKLQTFPTFSTTCPDASGNYGKA
jgi:hypothetical protein